MNSKKDTPTSAAISMLQHATGIVRALEQGRTLLDLGDAGVLKTFEDTCARHGVEHEWLMEEVGALLTEIALHVEDGQIASEDEVVADEGYAPVPMGAGCG